MSIKSLRDFILDNNLTEKDTLLLNQVNFDNLALEYRRTYNDSLTVPFFLLRVLIQEDYTNKVRIDSIGIVEGDTNRFENDYNYTLSDQPDDSLKYETIYRCGWCGNVVDSDGSEFNSATKQFKIDIIHKYENTVTFEKVNGACCPNGHD